MTTLSWPASFRVNVLELRVRPNTRVFTSPYSAETQVLQLGGDRWVANITLQPAVDVAEGLAREAFFDRLASGVDTVALYHFKQPTPRGSFATAPVPFAWTRSGPAFTWTRSGPTFTWSVGTLAVLNGVAAGADACTLQTLAGRPDSGDAYAETTYRLLILCARLTGNRRLQRMLTALSLPGCI